MLAAVSTGLTGHQLTVMWAQVGLLLLFARLLGSLARKVGQSAVVGELAAGLVLGPSVLGRLFPSAMSWFLPAHSAVQSGLLEGVSTISLARSRKCWEVASRRTNHPNVWLESWPCLIPCRWPPSRTGSPSWWTG